MDNKVVLDSRYGLIRDIVYLCLCLLLFIIVTNIFTCWFILIFDLVATFGCPWNCVSSLEQ